MRNSDTDERDEDIDGNCTTTASFDDHGVDDGSDLIRQTYDRLAADDDGTFEPTDRFFDRLADAFMRSYLTATGEFSLPDDVAPAIDDARTWTAIDFADEQDADLRTQVVPTFYQYAAGFHCTYRELDSVSQT